MSEIRIDHVTKKFDNAIAIKDLSFLCRDGEFVVVLGKPGAGKTTLLRMISGIDEPTSGEIYIGDTLVNGQPPEKRNVCMAFETYALYPHISVKQNMLSPLMSSNININKEEREKRIKEVATLLEIEELLDRKPSQLSGGQRQRVSLARALVKSENANCTLLDEPISHLDARLRNSMRGELKKYLKNKGASVIYTTADYAEALGIADRIIVIIEGVLHMYASAEEVFNNPQDLGVANMIGDPKINFFECTALKEVVIGNQAFSPSDIYLDGVKHIGIRPIDIDVSPIEKANSIPGNIYVTEPIGYEQIVRVMVDKKMVNIKMPLENNVFSINQPVWLEMKWKKGLLFDNGGMLKGTHE